MTTWWASGRRRVVLPATIPEVCYLLQTRIGTAAEEAFVRAVADGEFVIEPLDDEDFPRIADLVHPYRDLPLGFADASIVAVAERIATREILTTDRQHFGVVRPRHTKALTLVP